MRYERNKYETSVSYTDLCNIASTAVVGFANYRYACRGKFEYEAFKYVLTQ